jgi:hypothetical protein
VFGSNTTTAAGHDSFRSTPDVHTLAKKHINELQGNYATSTRTSIYEKRDDTLPLHPLDSDLIKENSGIQLKNVVELERQPNSKNVSRNYDERNKGKLQRHNDINIL